MDKIIHRAGTRGYANHGWLEAYHSFSFANYYNPERVNFGLLRVLNDDTIAAGKGFGMHPHDNMEIITIPLNGALEHKDNLGNGAVINQGDVQVMSAGTGIYHSEYNKNTDKPVSLLQIWIIPNEKDVKPRYDQISIRDIEEKNKFYQILSPNRDDQGVWIHQYAWFYIGRFNKGTSDSYNIKRDGNGIYMFVIEGTIEIDGEILTKRDAIGINNTNSITVNSTEDSNVLLIDIPMSID
ncbi:MAG: pirin family protein [Bacteroidales bacterium]|jgi:redox-sensitive bicupin YhaK (pirin superfamily)|nr:pirin family protein [Bacteroidales bacterium]